MRLAGQLRAHGLRTGVYLGSSGKLAKQLKWANDQHAQLVLIYGTDEQATNEVTVRDMQSGVEFEKRSAAWVGGYSGAIPCCSSRRRPSSRARAAARVSPSAAATMDPFIRMCHLRAKESGSATPASSASSHK